MHHCRRFSESGSSVVVPATDYVTLGGGEYQSRQFRIPGTLLTRRSGIAEKWKKDADRQDSCNERGYATGSPAPSFLGDRWWGDGTENALGMRNPAQRGFPGAEELLYLVRLVICVVCEVTRPGPGGKIDPLTTAYSKKTMTPYYLPHEADCIALLEKYETPHHIILHSKRVWDVGRLLGERLVANNVPLDMQLVRASCLLHDIGKYPCILDGTGYHDVRGEQILEQEGFPEVARIIVQHVVLKGHATDPVREEHVVFYSDKRVVHDRLVSLDERFDYLEETYGKTPGAVKRLHGMKEETRQWEERIFFHLDFGPADVLGLLD
jgi:uncharacterized protein